MKYVGIRKENNLYKILESNDFQDIKGLFSYKIRFLKSSVDILTCFLYTCCNCLILTIWSNFVLISSFKYSKLFIWNSSFSLCDIKILLISFQIFFHDPESCSSIYFSKSFELIWIFQCTIRIYRYFCLRSFAFFFAHCILSQNTKLPVRYCSI